MAVQAGVSHLLGRWGWGKLARASLCCLSMRPRAARPRGPLLSPLPGFVPLLPRAEGLQIYLLSGSGEVLSLHGQERSKEAGIIAQGTAPAVKPGLLKGAEDPAHGGVSCPKTANCAAELEAQTCSCPVWLGARSITLMGSPWKWQ